MVLLLLPVAIAQRSAALEEELDVCAMIYRVPFSMEVLLHMDRYFCPWTATLAQPQIRKDLQPKWLQKSKTFLESQRPFCQSHKTMENAKTDRFLMKFSLGLHLVLAGGLEAVGLEAGGLEAGGLEVAQRISDLVTHMPVLKKQYRGPYNASVV